MRVTGLFRYPVKSLRGHAVNRARLERIGLADDRRWMVVDEAGRFLTIRQHPVMTQVDVALTPGGVRLRHPAAGEIEVATPGAGAREREVAVWRDTVPARLAEDAAHAFLSRVMGLPVRLVWLADPAARPVDAEFGRADDRTSFADGFPVLLATEESLADLNRRMPAAMEMARFRPNIVVAGAPAWAEDGWRTIRIGATTLRVVKPCARCAITTRDPETGAGAEGNEPLRTLAAFHRAANGGVIFGQNLIPDALGEITVGDGVTVLAEGASNLTP